MISFNTLYLKKPLFQVGKLCLVALFGILFVSCSQSHNNEEPHPKATEIVSSALPNDGSVQLFELTNQARIKKRLPALIVDPRLTMAALDHSKSMDRYEYFAHQGRDGGNFRMRMLRHGYPHSHSAENIAMVHDPTMVFQMWNGSPGHHKNMFNKKYTRIGIGRKGNYWTAVYSAPDGR